MRWNKKKRLEYLRLLQREWREAEGFAEYFWLSAHWGLNGLLLICVGTLGLSVLSRGTAAHQWLLKGFWLLLALVVVLCILFALRALVKAIAMFRQS